MKRLICTLMIAIALLTAIPVTAVATPTGYKEVKLTAKNAKKYFDIKKFKKKDEFGDYAGYHYAFQSKMLSKKYRLYSTKGFAVKISFDSRSKYKKESTNTYHYQRTITSMDGFIDAFGDHGWNYKVGKLSNVKYKKAKGTLIFIEPSNFLGIKHVETWDNGTKVYRIMLKYPYDDKTQKESHWDKEKQEYVVDYYYIYKYAYRDDNTLKRY